MTMWLSYVFPAVFGAALAFCGIGVLQKPIEFCVLFGLALAWSAFEGWKP